ncbi:hypothetical protein IV102_18320 [bacterium]|nr:hypothetical protein [bacterium]
MHYPKRFRKRHGVALILALLTTVILVTLSLAFMSLSLSEARTSRAYGYEETSVQAASHGLEYALVYMGHGSNPQITWDIRNWPNPTNAADLGFGFYNVLHAHNAPVIASDLMVTVTNITQDPTLEAFVPANLPNTEKIRLREDLRRIRFVTPGGLPRLVPLNSDLAFTTDTVVEPILVARNQGRHDFRLVSTARVYQLPPGGAPSAGQTPLATRVIEARVKESSFDYAHFIANGRTWNVNGKTPGNSQQVPDPNNPNATIDMADYVFIPPDYTEQGPMRVDGQDPAQVNPNSPPALGRVVNNSGNLRFAEGADDGNVKFTHKLTINKPANLYQDNNLTDSTMAGFNGGFVPLASRVGIPDFRRDDMILASKFRVSETDKSGFFKIPTAEIPGALGNNQPPPRGTDADLGPFYDGYQPVVINGQTYQVPKPFDYRPRVPNIEVTLNQDTVKIVKRNTATNEVMATDEFSQSQLQMGILYVEGGNVVVKTGPNKFRGKLSIVAGEAPGRESFTSSEESVYSKAAREFYNYEKARWDLAKKLGQNPVAADYKTPPYTAAFLQAAHNAQPPKIAASVEAGMAANQPLWPAPEAEVSGTGPTRYMVEREGNVVVADDVVYSGTAGDSLGLFAQNFVLLNDTTPSSTLNIDAVLLSAERSVSLDWDNTGRQNEASWAAMMKTVDENGQPISRTVNINGSVIGEYIDVEGDLRGRGYAVQNFKYDLALRNANPPFMPRLNLAQLAGGYRFMILHYLDRGSLSTAGILGP